MTPRPLPDGSSSPLADRAAMALPALISALENSRDILALLREKDGRLTNDELDEALRVEEDVDAALRKAVAS